MEFWNQFNDIVEERDKPFNIRKVSTSNWYEVAIGSSKSHLTMELVNRDGYVRLGLYMKDDKENYDKLFSSKYEIEKELSLELDWTRESTESISRISYNLYGLDFDNKDNYYDLMNKMIDIIVEMKRVFKKYM